MSCSLADRKCSLRIDTEKYDAMHSDFTKQKKTQRCECGKAFSPIRVTQISCSPRCRKIRYEKGIRAATRKRRYERSLLGQLRKAEREIASWEPILSEHQFQKMREANFETFRHLRKKPWLNRSYSKYQFYEIERRKRWQEWCDFLTNTAKRMKTSGSGNVAPQYDATILKKAFLREFKSRQPKTRPSDSMAAFIRELITREC